MTLQLHNLTTTSIPRHHPGHLHDSIPCEMPALHKKHGCSLLQQSVAPVGVAGTSETAEIMIGTETEKGTDTGTGIGIGTGTGKGTATGGATEADQQTGTGCRQGGEHVGLTQSHGHMVAPRVMSNQVRV